MLYWKNPRCARLLFKMFPTDSYLEKLRLLRFSALHELISQEFIMKNATQRIPCGQDLIFSVQRIFEGAMQQKIAIFQQGNSVWTGTFRDTNVGSYFKKVFYVARADFLKNLKWKVWSYIYNFPRCARLFLKSLLWKMCHILKNSAVRALFFRICGGQKIKME